MKLLSEKIIKNYKVCLGKPFKVRVSRDMLEICNDSSVVHESVVSMEKQWNFGIDRANAMEIIERAQKEADIIINEAESEACRIIKMAKGEAEKCAREIEEARQKGYNDGCNEAKTRYKNVLKEIETLRKEAVNEYNRMLKNAENDMVDIILAITRKILGEEVSRDKRVILNLVREAIDACSSKNNIVLKLSPCDYDYVIKETEKLEYLSEGIKNLEIIKDYSLKDGDCIAETPYGCVETSIQVKMNKIEDAFRECPVLVD
ncbi:MAG: hypothetical protein GX754_07675 [Clostridiaceae bacterium]|nr:hypothetical protein [Clostridiaceae bacterium]